MKRKNPDFNKARKFIRKTKFSENLLSTSYLYIKLFFLWFIVVVSDFLIEFRFEYLWPFYLCVRNVYDIFKYQGFAFSAFFVFITLTSNAICFFLMPVQWLFFTASTYVWFQYVWNSEKGICLQTFAVWLIFVYVEATVRLKELKNMPSHLDLCRPMAAWCIGYPFVSLGFGFKKYLNYKIMLQRQKEVRIENDYTFNTINRLHVDEHSNEPLNGTNNNKEDDLNTIDELNNNEQIDESEDEKEKRISNYSSENQAGSNIVLLIEHIVKLASIYLNAIIRRFMRLISSGQAANEEQQSSIESFEINSCQQTNPHQITSSYQENHLSTQQLDSLTSQPFQSATSSASSAIQQQLQSSLQQSVSDEREPLLSTLDKERLKKIKQENKNEIKKMKNDLQTIRQSELDYKEKLNKMQASRNELKYQCNKLQHDNTALQTKLQNFVNTKQQDKNTINELEKRLQEERKARIQLEKQLTKYSKVVECGETCKQRRLEFDETLAKLHDELRFKDAKIMKLNEENLNDKQLLVSALEKMQDRTQQLDTSLREETRLKLELFSVLGETRRQLEMNQIILFQKSNEVEELNCKISELMAVLPPMSTQDPYSSSIFLPNFIGNRNNELNKQTQAVDTSGSMLKNNLLKSSNQQQSQSAVDPNNLSNNSNISAKTSSSSSTKGSLSDWKNLSSLESTSDLK